jgi:hypothetical protein
VRLYQVVDGVLGAIENDATLALLFGSRVRQSGDAPIESRVMEWSAIGDTEGELYNPVLIQFDLFTESSALMVEAEVALRRLLHHDLPVELGGVGLWSQFQARREIPDTPKGILGVSQDYLFTPLRTKYAGTENGS